tara:strand:+ start:393 stop:677 length:285 start_codon:yes stop_codon:yes gene_type:complete
MVRRLSTALKCRMSCFLSSYSETLACEEKKWLQPGCDGNVGWDDGIVRLGVVVVVVVIVDIILREDGGGGGGGDVSGAVIMEVVTMPRLGVCRP